MSRLVGVKVVLLCMLQYPLGGGCMCRRDFILTVTKIVSDSTSKFLVNL